MAKAWQNTTGQSMDNPYRDYLSLFVDDLFVTLGLPEWPSSCALLQQLIRAAVRPSLEKLNYYQLKPSRY